MEILKFSTPTCVYCKVAHPSVVEFAKKQGATIKEVNADSEMNTSEEKELCEKYDIQGVPVVVVIEDGKEPDVRRGFPDIMQKVKG